MTIGWLYSYKNLSTGKNVSIVAFKGYAKSVDI